VQRSIKELGDNDILIAPDLTGVSFLDFNAADRAMKAGERATLALAPRLHTLAANDTLYAQLEANRLAPRPDRDLAKPLAKLEVKSTRYADGRALAAETGLAVGDGITLAGAQRAAGRLFGRGDFERVQTLLVDGPGGRELTSTPTEADGARSRVRLGLELSSDFRDDHRITVSALHLLSWINAWGGELRTTARIGASRGLSTQWWQPLGAGSPWFAQSTLEYATEPQDQFDGGRRVARASVTARTATVALGRRFGRSAEVQFGVTRVLGRGRVLLPQVADSVIDVAETNRYALLRYDTLNSLAFPTDGELLVAHWTQTPSLGAGTTTLAQSQVQGLSAFRLGEWGGHVYGEWAKSQSGFAPLRLGGFWRLTGAPRDSVAGATVLLGRAVLARRIGQMPPGLGGAIRTGVSFELGDAFAPNEAVRAARLRPAGSVFISVDTRFGPAYLAAGTARGLGSTVYVFLGPYW
jgi:NTE family protein